MIPPKKLRLSHLSRDGDDSPPMSPLTRIKQIRATREMDLVPVTENTYELDPVDIEATTISKQLTAEQRYWFYVERAVQTEYLSGITNESLEAIKDHVPKRLLEAEKLKSKIDGICNEIRQNHLTAMKQSIVDYILLDPKEQQRLMIPRFKTFSEPISARAPVPWHDTFQGVQSFMEENLYITNPVMLELHKINCQFQHCRIVDMAVFTPAILPISTNEFSSILKSQCTNFKNKMTNE
jgi:dynein heavy chain